MAVFLVAFEGNSENNQRPFWTLCFFWKSEILNSKETLILSLLKPLGFLPKLTEYLCSSGIVEIQGTKQENLIPANMFRAKISPS